MTRENPYFGICVGGPMDGEELEAAGPIYHFVERDSVAFAEENGMVKPEVRGHFYQHVTFHFGSEQFTFWRGGDLSIGEAMIRVFSHYKAEKRTVTRSISTVQNTLAMGAYEHLAIRDVKHRLLSEVAEDINVTIIQETEDEVRFQAELTVLKDGNAEHIRRLDRRCRPD